MELFINFVLIVFFAILFLFCAKNNEKRPSNLNYYIGIASVFVIILLTSGFTLNLIEKIC